jgi:hypothetical protein
MNLKEMGWKSWYCVHLAQDTEMRRAIVNKYDLIYDMIFIYCNWISTRWQWSVDLYKNTKETAICKWRNNTQNNTKTHNLQNIKQTFKTS